MTNTAPAAPALVLVADGAPRTTLVMSGNGPARDVTRQMYRVGGRVLVTDSRDEPATVYRVWGVAVNVDDASDIDIYLVRQTKRGTDYVNGLGLHEGATDVERFAADDTIRPESRAFWTRLAETLAMVRAELAPVADAVAQISDFPAADGQPVTERHARVCRERGHATHIKNGQGTGVCPRCGEVTTSESEQEAARLGYASAQDYFNAPGRADLVTATEAAADSTPQVSAP